MFEDSLMESQNRLSSPNQRWTTILSLTLQCSIAAAIIALPLLRPEALPFRVDAPKIVLPLKHVPPVPHIAAAHAAPPASASAPGQLISGPRAIPISISNTSDAPPASIAMGTGMSGAATIPVAVGTPSGTGPRVSVAPGSPATKSLVKVSTGVSNGLLLAPIKPIYPRIAVMARIGGTVEVEAIISKSGRIESARAVSGPEMLRQAALDAIRAARYRPYLLNGSPTEVETTITVNFKLSD